MRLSLSAAEVWSPNNGAVSIVSKIENTLGFRFRVSGFRKTKDRKRVFPDT